LSLTPAQVEEYIAEIGASEQVRARWQRQQRWRETYAKLAKSYVGFGDTAGDLSWREPVGLELEIVPLDDPILRGTLIEESTAADADWKSLFATLTLHVRPRP